MNSDNPLYENDAANHGNRETKENRTESQPQLPITANSAESDSPPSPNCEKAAYKNKRDWFDYVKFSAEIIGLLVLIAYTTFAALQWREIHHTMLVDQRAWMIAGKIEFAQFEVGKPVKIRAYIESTGHTPAISVINVGLSCSWNAGGVRPKFEDLDLLTPSDKTVVRPGGGIYIPGDPFPGEKLTQEKMDEITSGRIGLMESGKVWYDDIFGHEH